jgi:hypothetical protein
VAGHFITPLPKIRLFVYDQTSQHVLNRWVIRCTNKLSIWLCTANDLHGNWVTVPNNLINNVGERGCWIFWRNDISIFGKLSVRQNVFSAKSPLGKMSVQRNVRRQNVRSAKFFRRTVFRQSVFRQNVRVPSYSIICTVMCMRYLQGV